MLLLPLAALALVPGNAPSLLPAIDISFVVLICAALSAARSGLDRGSGAMLVDLRARVLDRSALPDLPPGWMLDTDLRSAHGSSFGGDFLLTARSPGGLDSAGAGADADLAAGPGTGVDGGHDADLEAARVAGSGADLEAARVAGSGADPGTGSAGRLDLVLVDVSGSGPMAGGRALLLTGAFEALLDTVPGAAFMAAANDHLLRHGDDESFATAVHVSLDLQTGRFDLIGAGHPPAVHYRAGSGRCQVLDDHEQGPALGLLTRPAFPARHGVLARGDALLLYTDGLVENRGLDVARGIDRLVGHADTLLLRGGPSLAGRISQAIRAHEGDDRALVVIRRT